MAFLVRSFFLFLIIHIEEEPVIGQMRRLLKRIKNMLLESIDEKKILLNKLTGEFCVKNLTEEVKLLCEKMVFNLA